MRVLRQSIASRVSLPVKVAFRNLLSELKIDRVSRQAARTLASLRQRRGLKIHLGCGTDLKPGWVNFDLLLNGAEPRALPDSETLFINYDMRRGLPLADDSCDLIYSSHFFEHLDYGDGVRLMRDCYRALRSGGVFRICLPNFKRTFEAYLQNDYEYFKGFDVSQEIRGGEPGTETLLDQINYAVYQNGEHKCVYDQEKVLLLLRKIGFTQVAPSVFQESIDVDTELRRNFSFYVEAVK